MKTSEGQAACLTLLQAVGEGYRLLSMYRCHVSIPTLPLHDTSPKIYRHWSWTPDSLHLTRIHLVMGCDLRFDPHALIFSCFKQCSPSHPGVLFDCFHCAVSQLLDACSQEALQTWVKHLLLVAQCWKSKLDVSMAAALKACICHAGSYRVLWTAATHAICHGVGAVLYRQSIL